MYIVYTRSEQPLDWSQNRWKLFSPWRRILSSLTGPVIKTVTFFIIISLDFVLLECLGRASQCIAGVRYYESTFHSREVEAMFLFIRCVGVEYAREIDES